MNKFTVRGFWSYPRSDKLNSEKLHKSMKANLETGYYRGADIFIDTEDIAPGNDWSRTIAREISKSYLFFWNQSPGWLQSNVCILELIAFHDHINQVVKFLYPQEKQDLALKEIWDATVIPIRIFDIGKNYWDEYPIADQNSYSFIRDQWEIKNYIEPTKNEIQKESFLKISQQLPADFFSNKTRKELDEFIENKSNAFEEKWHLEFHKKHDNDKKFDIEHNEGIIHKIKSIGDEVLFMIKTQQDKNCPSFWITDRPISAHGETIFSIEDLKSRIILYEKYGLSIPNKNQSDYLIKFQQKFNINQILKNGISPSTKSFWLINNNGEIHSSLNSAQKSVIWLVENN